LLYGDLSPVKTEDPGFASGDALFAVDCRSSFLIAARVAALPGSAARFFL
jgi:hypothetical protein